MKTWKSVFQVTDTGTWVFGQYWTIFAFQYVSFWKTLAGSKEGTYHIFRQTGTPEMFQYSPILGHSGIWDLKYTFSRKPYNSAYFNVDHIHNASAYLWLFFQNNINLMVLACPQLSPKAGIRCELTLCPPTLVVIWLVNTTCIGKDQKSIFRVTMVKCDHGFFPRTQSKLPSNIAKFPSISLHIFF